MMPESINGKSKGIDIDDPDKIGKITSGHMLLLDDKQIPIRGIGKAKRALNQGNILIDFSHSDPTVTQIIQEEMKKAFEHLSAPGAVGNWNSMRMDPSGTMPRSFLDT